MNLAHKPAWVSMKASLESPETHLNVTRDQSCSGVGSVFIHVSVVNLSILHFTETTDGGANSNRSSSGGGVSTTSSDLSARAALPDAYSSSLDSVL